jgi:hypothetical protein
MLVNLRCFLELVQHAEACSSLEKDVQTACLKAKKLERVVQEVRSELTAASAPRSSYIGHASAYI